MRNSYIDKKIYDSRKFKNINTRKHNENKTIEHFVGQSNPFTGCDPLGICSGLNNSSMVVIAICLLFCIGSCLMQCM